MPLVGKGRLSVQPVSDTAHAAILRMGARGGWVARSVKGPWVASSPEEGEAGVRKAERAKEEKEGALGEESEREGTKKRPSTRTSTPPPPTPTTSTKEEEDEPRRSKRTKI